MNYPLTISTAHELKAKVDAILKVMWHQADKLSWHHPVQPALSHPSIIMVTKENLVGGTAVIDWFQHLKVNDGKLLGLALVSDLGSGSGISDKLFVSVPLSAILAELEVEARYISAKHTTTLG